MRKAIETDPNRRAYRDRALIQPRADETESLELFTRDPATRDAVEHIRKVKCLPARDRAAHERYDRVAVHDVCSVEITGAGCRDVPGIGISRVAHVVTGEVKLA